ncbi:sodium-solute symporter putative [Vibrio maritimus]|uniref:Sodium-solute symporter putative n=1 Tax=Vibrio maritimus TaxID=990268 RepID=A0A090T6W8_9VIBR|nr:sodium-solute symporter putative [Vibrio maritimus]
MVLIPNPFWGRMAFLFCGGVVLTVGTLLLKSAKETKVLNLQTQS